MRISLGLLICSFEDYALESRKAEHELLSLGLY